MASIWWVGTNSNPATGANWSSDVYIESVPGVAQVAIDASDQHTIVLASLNISQTWTEAIGTGAQPGGYWQIGATTVTIGIPPSDGSSPGGSGRIKLNIGSTATTINILNTAQSSTDTGYEPVRLLGSAIAALNMTAGFAGLATSTPGETATVTTVNGSGGILDLGAGVTVTTVNVAGGATVNTNGGATTCNVAAGSTAILNGATAITNVNVAGSVSHNIRNGGVGTTTMNIYGGGTVDFSGAPAAVTVTTINLYATGKYTANPASPSHLTVTNRNLILCGSVTAS